MPATAARHLHVVGPSFSTPAELLLVLSYELLIVRLQLVAAYHTMLIQKKLRVLNPFAMATPRRKPESATQVGASVKTPVVTGVLRWALEDLNL